MYTYLARMRLLNQNLAQSLLLGDVINNVSSNSAVNGPMFGKNYWLTKCFVFTTNFEPILKLSVANNTLLSQIFVKKPIYFYILDLYFRTGKNRDLDLYFRTEGAYPVTFRITIHMEHT